MTLLRRRTTVAFLVTLAAAGIIWFASRSGAAVGDRVVHVTVEHSRFVLQDGGSQLTVRDGETIRFVVENLDPIAHELIAGPLATQRGHEFGNDRHHDGAHGAVSVGPGETAETTHTFTAPGEWIGCHLPRHWDYGMRLPVRVVAS